MNETHWHLFLTHLPIIFPICGLLIMVGGLIFKSEILKRTAYCIFILGAISAVVAFSTGEGAEEVVEGIQGIDERHIEIHEEAAEIFAILTYLLGGLSLIGLWANWTKKPISKVILGLTIMLAFVVLFYAKQAETTGSEIRRTEIRKDDTMKSPAINNRNNQDED